MIQNGLREQGELSGFIVLRGWYWSGSFLTQVRALRGLNFLQVLMELIPRLLTAACPDVEQKGEGEREAGRNKRGKPGKLSAVKHQKEVRLYHNSFLVFDR